MRIASPRSSLSRSGPWINRFGAYAFLGRIWHYSLPDAADSSRRVRRIADAGQACSGYLIEHDGFRLLVDVGYATVPRLLERTTADRVDAVFISHGHPDHCADLNPLLRARVLRDDPAAPLPVYALPGTPAPSLVWTCRKSPESWTGRSPGPRARRTS